MPATGGQLWASYSATVAWAGGDAVSRWWDGVELWLTQLGLAPQVALLMLVLLPTGWWAVRLLDWVVGLVFQRFGHHDTGNAHSSEGPR